MQYPPPSPLRTGVVDMVALAVKDFDRAQLSRVADGLAAAVAVSLPWSTSATSILLVLWLLVSIPTLQLSELRREVITPAGGLPILLWLMACAGTLWADVSFSERLTGLSGYHKLLVVPLLLAQFRRSGRVHWVYIGFFAGAAAVLALSWLLTIAPSIPWKKMQVPGVPVKDYLTQSGIFQLCVFGLAYLAIEAWISGRHRFALLTGTLMLLFFGNIIYVASGRTALVLMPIFVLLLGLRLFGWRGLAIACVIGAILGGIIWSTSEYLRIRITTLAEEAEQNPNDLAMTSTGQRIEFYRHSMRIIGAAPIIGHGTGTIHARFKEITAGHIGAAGVATKNPHQQTLAVAIQLGIGGAILLWAMWIAQLLLFRGEGAVAWFGLIVVAQNILGSLFNSHLFDFTQGWIYVFGVGALGGAVLRETERSARKAGIGRDRG
jgi:hypothetical protein